MPKMQSPKQITGTAALLVEGEDEVNFFKALLVHIGMPGVDILDLGGKTKFKYTVPAALRMPNFSNVQVYAIIRDADNNADAAFQSVQGVLRDNRQPCPQVRNTYASGSPKVGVYILPGSIGRGMLEDLCMDTVTEHPVMPCVDAFMGCIRDKVAFPQPVDPDAPRVPNFQHPNNPSKSKAKAFLAAQQHDQHSVGTAALAGVWNLEHACLDELKAFLRQLSGDRR